MIEKTSYSESLRKTFYKENTNVLSYYIITVILLNNYQDFLLWCKTHNSSLLQFNKTIETQSRFCDFIASKYKTNDFLYSIDCSEQLLNKVKKMNNKILKANKKNNNNKTKTIRTKTIKTTSNSYPAFLLNNLRMTLCELG